MSTLTLPQMNGSKAAKPTNHWLQASVHDFFSTINWEDHPPEVQETRAAAQAHNEPLSLNTSVGRFFAAINWDGSAIAAPAPIEPAKPQPSNDLTLDDFSDLF